MLDAVEEDLDLVARHDCNDRRSVQVLASLDPASRTAYKTFSTEGLKKNRTFLATVLPSTWTVSSPRLPSTRSTSTPGSFRKASATRAACSRVPPQTGHWRMVTFFIADLLSIFYAFSLRGSCLCRGFQECRRLRFSYCSPGVGRRQVLCHGFARSGRATRFAADRAGF